MRIGEEGKLADLAFMIDDLKVGEYIDFGNGTADDVGNYGGWCGVRRVSDYYDSDVTMYVIGHYGSYASTKLYSLCEYDDMIGDFCAKDFDVVHQIMAMIADYLEREFGETVCSTMTWEYEEGNE